MQGQWEQYGRRVLSGEDGRVSAVALRAALALAEPFYAGLMAGRNLLYDRGFLKSHRLPRPTVGVGNLTAGGTGKTPVVRWLAEQLAEQGHFPAVLLRGYKAMGHVSDEEQMLREHLLRDGRPIAIVQANPNRLEGAEAALGREPRTSLFILDDAFQHRRVARDFDLVLINALEPFGHGHVHPRGLLREPIGGISRADAVLITHASHVPPERITWIEERIRAKNAGIPIYRCDHIHTGLSGGGPLEQLRDKRIFAFAGIGQPESFGSQLAAEGNLVGHLWFGDHHHYSEADVRSIRRQAADAGADVVLTTEKDWVKVRDLAPASEDALSIHAVELGLRFRDDDGAQLLTRIRQRVGEPRVTASVTS